MTGDAACERMRPLILRSVDGRLAPDARAALDAHVAACAACRAALADQQAVASLLGELPIDAGPRQFAARVRARVVPRGALVDLVNWRAWTWRLVPVAALLGLLAWLPSSGGSARFDTALDSWAAGAGQSPASLVISDQTDADELLLVAVEGQEP